jgi:hypothetical protein
MTQRRPGRADARSDHDAHLLPSRAARDQPHGGLSAGRGVDTCTALRLVQCRCRAAGARSDDGRPAASLLPTEPRGL